MNHNQQALGIPSDSGFARNALVQADKHDGQFARFQYTPTRALAQK
jgi:hypothetical protein